MLRKILVVACSGAIVSCTHLPWSGTSDRHPAVSNSQQQSGGELSPWHHESLELCYVDASYWQRAPAPPYIDVWDRIRDGFQLNIQHNGRIERELKWLAKYPSYMSRVSERASRYLHFIAEEVASRGLPMELALLPIVESTFDPFAYSHGQASGLWQFIPSTGKAFGLKQNWWYDGRRDVVASTKAALDYLEQLHNRMNDDWLLALASYNSGAGNVRKAARKNAKSGKATDYWSLNLPRETEAYVPRLLAIKELLIKQDPHAADLFAIPNKPYFEEVNIGSQIDLAQAAEFAGITMDELYALNPAFNRWATDPDGPHTLLMPIENAALFREKLASIPPDQRVTWDRYVIKSGDTLSTIAQNHNTTTELLRSLNNLQSSRIRAGRTLLIPKASADFSHYTYSLAQRIKRKQSHGGTHKTKHVVKQGESLWSIGKQYNVSSKTLARWNGIAPSDTIRPGQQLVIRIANSADKGNSKTVRKVAYKVRSGDSLARIANRFNVRVKDIVSWNTVNPQNYLQPGDNLTLFVDVKNIN